jgi:hypothetical protein
MILSVLNLNHKLSNGNPWKWWFSVFIFGIENVFGEGTCNVDGSSIGQQIFVAKSEPAKTSTDLF